jgi:hypothetical protein
MMMRPSHIRRIHKRRHSVFIACRMFMQSAAIADALVGLNMRAGGDFLQVDFDGLTAVFAFECEDAGWFEHGN